MVKAAKAPVGQDTANPDVDAYNKVVASAELRALQLVHLEFDVEPQYFMEDLKREIGYEVFPHQSMFDASSNMAACMVSLEVKAKDDSSVLLNCSATYSIVYDLTAECEEAAVQTFLHRVGVFACYPYFRALFASLDWSANTGLPPLPIHREHVRPREKTKGKKKLASKQQAETSAEA